MSLDLNVYPEDYPIFTKTRQYLIRGHIANLESTKPKTLKINTIPGHKRDCESNHEKTLSPFFLPELSHIRASSVNSNYQTSYYPTSPLNPELEEQCMLLEMFRNFNKIDFRKPKFKTPSKIVRKTRKLRFSAEITNFHNFPAFACKEFTCPDCLENKCNCNTIDTVSNSIKLKSFYTQI